MDIENDQCEKLLRMSTGANARGSMRHRRGARRCGWSNRRKAGLMGFGRGRCAFAKSIGD
jgi:hypothetical protein